MSKLPEPKLSAEERELQDRRFGELMDGINGIIEDLERLARHEEAEASGAPRRRSVILGPRVRSVAGLGREPKPTGENGKSKKLSRTEVWKEQQEEQAAARQAMLPPRPAPHQPDQKPVDETIIKFGTVQHYDSRSMSGVVSIGGGPGRLELPFSASEIMRAGITALHPSQSVECQTRGDSMAAWWLPRSSYRSASELRLLRNWSAKLRRLRKIIVLN